MTRTGFLALLVAFMGLTLVACGDDSSSSSGDGDGDNSGDSGPGDGDGGNWEEEFPRNLDCPAGPPPSDGEGSQHGECCFRGKPNSARLEEQGDSELASIGYRMNFQTPANLPETLGAAPIPTLAIARGDLHEQILLIRTEGPREGGVGVSGPGFTTVGSGSYNCDGTYSFYGDQAATPNPAATYPGANDASRWEAQRVPVTINSDKTGIERVEIAWEDDYKGFSYTSYVEANEAGDAWELDWEIVTENFEMLEFDYDEDDVNCLGVRDGDVWEPAGLFAVYAQIQYNNDKANDIFDLQGQNFCQLVSFGILSAQEDLDGLNCETTARCEPGTDGCRWKALPDSLCPLDDAENDIFACHVGADNNGGEPNCTAEAPTAHSEDNEGQCCSPLGDDPDLPACNGWRIVNEMVAASANITEEPAQHSLEFCTPE